MATAIVTATAGLVRELNPDLTAPEVVRLLKETARRAPGAGWSPDLGWGMLDARNAVQTASRLDRRPPVSQVLALPATTHRRSITVRWRGRDDAPPGVQASGIDVYELWRSADGRAPVRVARTRRTSATVRGRPGGRYSFYTIAVDRAGNREKPPARPYATVRVALG
jgi:hypothetical protein